MRARHPSAIITSTTYPSRTYSSEGWCRWQLLSLKFESACLWASGQHFTRKCCLLLTTTVLRDSGNFCRSADVSLLSCQHQSRSRLVCTANIHNRTITPSSAVTNRSPIHLMRSLNREDLTGHRTADHLLPLHTPTVPTSKSPNFTVKPPPEQDRNTVLIEDTDGVVPSVGCFTQLDGQVGSSTIHCTR